MGNISGKKGYLLNAIFQSLIVYGARRISFLREKISEKSIKEISTFARISALLIMPAETLIIGFTSGMTSGEGSSKKNVILRFKLTYSSLVWSSQAYLRPAERKQLLTFHGRFDVSTSLSNYMGNVLWSKSMVCFILFNVQS